MQEHFTPVVVSGGIYDFVVLTFYFLSLHCEEEKRTNLDNKIYKILG